MAQRKLGKKSTTRPIPPFKKYIVLSLILILSFIGYYFGISKNNNVFYSDLSKTSTQTGDTSECALQGMQDKRAYLPTYIVKSGDTLLSIAASKLGDTSRVSELISLNKDQYPELAITNPFLEQGWKLSLPPESVESSNGSILVVSGNINIGENGWGVNFPNSGVGPFGLKVLEKFNTSNEISEGDCVTVIYEGRTSGNYSSALNIISVELQK